MKSEQQYFFKQKVLNQIRQLLLDLPNLGFPHFYRFENMCIYIRHLLQRVKMCAETQVLISDFMKK